VGRLVLPMPKVVAELLLLADGRRQTMPVGHETHGEARGRGNR
jgi:hypothetical protein